MAMPSVPASNAIRTLSTSNWRTSRPRPAPSAARIDISRARVADRASNRLAAWLQAINNTTSTAAIIIIGAGCVALPT